MRSTQSNACGTTSPTTDQTTTTTVTQHDDNAGGSNACDSPGPVWPNLLIPGAGWANDGCADKCAHDASCATATNATALQTLGNALGNLTVTNGDANDAGDNSRNIINNIVDYEADNNAAQSGFRTTSQLAATKTAIDSRLPNAWMDNDLGHPRLSPPTHNYTNGDDADNRDKHKPEGVILLDTWNESNELSRKAMLWTVRYLWWNRARFAFNCYKHQSQLIMRRPGGTAEIILSWEGVTQGDPLSMVLYRYSSCLQSSQGLLS